MSKSKKRIKSNKKIEKTKWVVHSVFLLLVLILVVASILVNNEQGGKRLIETTLLDYGIGQYEVSKLDRNVVKKEETYTILDLKRKETYQGTISYQGKLWKTFALNEFYESGIDTKVKEGIIAQVAEIYTLELTDDIVSMATLKRIPIAHDTGSTLYRLELNQEKYMAEWDSGSGTFIIYLANNETSPTKKTSN